MKGAYPIDLELDCELYHFPEVPKLFVDFKLTFRQMDCLSLDYKGKSAKEAGAILGIERGTHSNTLNEIKKAIRNYYTTFSSFIEAADASSFLIKRFNNLQYISKLNNVLHKFKENNTSNKDIDIYYKSDAPPHYVKDLKKHLETAGFKIGGVYSSNVKSIVDKENISLYIYTQGKYKPSSDDLDYDYVIDIHVSGYVTSLFNFLKEYCDRKQVEEEIVKHRLYIYDGVNCEYFPKDMIKLLDDMKSGKYVFSREKSLLEDLYRPLINCFREVHNKMKTRNKLLPTVVYSSVCVMLVTGLYALYPKPEDNVLLEQNLKIAEDILINRDDLLNQINNELSSKDSKIVALIGAGGAGKTTLARLHLKKCQKHRNKIAFEINAETEESLYTSLEKVLYNFIDTPKDREEWDFVQKASKQNDKNQRLIKFARKKLSSSEKWLVVFDNVEDLELVITIIPSDSVLYKKGCVLLTTRNQNIKSIKTVKSNELRCIDVGELVNGEKYKLFTLVLEKFSDRKYEKAEVEKFLEKIPNYPLDVVSVACYLGSSSISLEEYQKEMKKMSSHFDEVNRGLMSEVTSYGKTRYGIVAVTLEKILHDLKNEEMYKNLLLLVSMCDSQNIPIKLLEKCSSEDAIKLLLRELKKHSFISFKEDSLSIHRSIQELWFLIMKSKIDEKSFGQFMNIIFEKAANLKDINHMYYKNNVIQRDRKWFNNLLLHLESLTKKLNFLPIPEEKKAKYEVYSLFAISSIYQKNGVDFRKTSNLQHNIIKIDKEHSILSDYERSMLFGYTGYILLFLDPTKGLNLIQEAVSLSDKLTEAEPLNVMNLTLLGMGYMKNGKIENALTILEKAVKKIPIGNEAWKKKLYLQAESVKVECILANKVTDKNLLLQCKNDIVNMLKLVNADGNMYQKEKPKEIAGFVPILKRDFAVVCNLLEEYEQISDIYQDSKFIVENFPNTSSFMYLDALSEYGLSLLRIGEVNKAKNTLETALISMEVDGIPESKQILVISYIIEALIRLNDFVSALDFISEKVSGFANLDVIKDCRSRICYTDCLYNAAYVSYKLGKLDDAKKYFGMFMKNIHELCGTLISESECKRLESEGAFSEQADVEAYLVNAYKIYAAIFGEDHAFVKDYVRKNVQGDVPALSSKMPVDKVEHPTAIGA